MFDTLEPRWYVYVLWLQCLSTVTTISVIIAVLVSTVKKIINKYYQ